MILPTTQHLHTQRDHETTWDLRTPACVETSRKWILSNRNPHHHRAVVIKPNETLKNQPSLEVSYENSKQVKPI